MFKFLIILNRILQYVVSHKYVVVQGVVISDFVDARCHLPRKQVK